MPPIVCALSNVTAAMVFALSFMKWVSFEFGLRANRPSLP